MKLAYLDCATGISGDMTLAALLDAGVDEKLVRQAIDSLGLPGVELIVTHVIKGGFHAQHVQVRHPEQHAHRHLGDIQRILAGARLSESQRQLALRMFRHVAEAEARVHGSTPDEVHFHEVGAIDSIVDIIGVAVGFDLLGAEQVIASPVPTGHGRVNIAHGVCPIPAPGTAELLKGVPLADVPIEAELTTPTGAAILRTMVQRYGRLPAMSIEQVGYGAGTMDFPSRANVLRLFVGTATPAGDTDTVVLLETNLDDVPGEWIGYARERLLAAGALDVYATPIQMKKDRPAVMLSVIAHPADAPALEDILFAETGTFGIRRQAIERSKRQRRPHTVETVWGPVAGKLGWRGTGPIVFTPEYDACALLAREQNRPLPEIYRAAEAAYLAAPADPDLVRHVPQFDPHAHDHTDAGASGSPRPPAKPRSHDHSHDHGHDHGHHHG